MQTFFQKYQNNFPSIRNYFLWPLYPQIEFDIYSKRTGEKLDRELGFDVDVKDINDNPPTFRDTQITADVMENTPVGEKHLPNKYEYTYP